MGLLDTLKLAHIRLLIYPILIIFIELFLVYGDVLSGFLAHIIILFIIIIHYLVTKNVIHQQILPIFILPPLIRILSLTMVFPNVPLIILQGIIGFTLFIPAILSIRLLTCPWQNWIDFTHFTGADAIVVLSGIPLGYISFLILQNEPIVDATNLPYTLLTVAILMIFSVLIEEIIFRGIIVFIAVKYYGRLGLLIASLMYASLHFSAFSWAYVLLMACVGFGFSWYAMWKKDLWAVVFAHSLMIIGQGIFWSTIALQV